jgi:hypothetical protein
MGKKIAALVVGVSLVLGAHDVRADERQDCIARATAAQTACQRQAMATETDKPPVLRGTACTNTFSSDVAACEKAGRPSPQPQSSEQAKYGFACMGAKPDEIVLCHKCADESNTGRGTAVMWGTQGAYGGASATDRAFLACRDRMVSERAEAKSLVDHFGQLTPAWFESASDADLDTVVGTTLKQLARLNAISIDLGKGPLPDFDNTAAKVVDDLQASVTKEKACRADKKCMDARAAKKAEEQFFTSVVQPMCQADQDREAAVADMAHERANPSGYVDKTKLYNDGAVVQQSQEQLAAAAPAYVKVRHHPWRGWRTECHQAP